MVDADDAAPDDAVAPLETPVAEETAGDDDLCAAVSKRAVECSQDLLPPDADRAAASAEMAETFTKQCSERTTAEPERVEVARGCLDEANCDAFLKCMGDTIGR